MNAAQLGIDRHRFFDVRLRCLRLALLNQRTRRIQPTVRILRFRFRHLLERVLRALQVALQQHPDAPVVPALTIEKIHLRLPLRRLGTQLQLRRAHRQRHDRHVRNPPLHLARNIRRNVRRIERPLAAIMPHRHEARILSRLRLARIRVLRVVVRELAVVQLRSQRNRTLGILRDVHAIVHRIGRARRNQSNIQQAACLKRIALVDRIALTVELIRAIEVRALLHRTLAVILDITAPEDDLAVCILALQLEPDVE